MPSAYTKSAYFFFFFFFFRPVQSISFQDEETKLLLRPFLVHIANASFRAGISPSFFRYQSPSSDTSLNYDWMYPAYIRSYRYCPLSNILCKNELVKKLAKWKLIDSRSILCTKHYLDLGLWKHFRVATDNSHWSDIHSFLLTNPCRIFMKYCCLAREEHRKSMAQHQLG